MSGGTPDTTVSEYWGTEISWVTPSEVSKLKNRFLSETERYISTLGLKNSSAQLIPQNSIIVCTRATVGDCCINVKELTTNQGFKTIIPFKNNCDFIYYLIANYKNNLRRLSCGSTFLEISKKDFENMTVLIPPIEEQKKIAEVLSCWDDGIEKLEKVIELKEKQKRGLIQRLLSGKTRIKGFSIPWKQVKLGEIGMISSAGVDKKIIVGEEDVILLNYMDVYKKDFISSGDLLQHVTAKLSHKLKCDLKKGDIFFTPSSETRGDIGRSAVITENIKDGVYSYHIVRLRPTIEIDLSFSAYIFKTDSFYKQAYVFCEGSGQRYVISQDDFRLMNVYMPTDIKEQTAIAEVLTSTDNEIFLLKRKCELFKQQKKWLMQQLLTGKKRLV